MNRSAMKFGGGGIFLLSALLLAGLAACGGDEPTAARPPAAPAPAPFQPQPVEVTLGASGETVTLMTTQDGGFTLNGEAFESGKTVTSESGNVYTLLLADGAWNARYDAHEVEVKLGSLEETVKLVKGEDGGYMLGEMAVESGVTKHTAANGNVYTLVMGEDGMWMAQYQASETMLALGTSGTTVTIVKNEDGTYTVGGEPLMSGGTWTAGNGGEYTLAMGEDGMWTATYVPGKGTVTVGGTGLTLVATRAEDGTWSVVNPVTGETEMLSEGGQITTAGNTYTLTSDGGGKWTATYNPMRVEVQLGTIGGTVTLMRAEDGSYWLGEMQVETGVTPVTSENGNRYTLVMGEDGTWMGRYEAPTTTVTLGTSGTMVTIVMQEDGSWTLDGEVFMSGGQHTAGNGNVYRLSRVDGVWMAEYVPMTMEVQGTGGLQAVKREDGTGYDVDGAMLGMDGMGDIETETSGWYRVVMQDGALMGTRLDNVAVRNPTRFKTDKLSAHPSILGDDRKTEVNEARTALVVAGENYPFGDLLGDGVSQRKGKNFVAEARGKLLEIREKIVAVLDVFDTDSQRDTQVGRQWGTESANNATTNVKGVLETVFGKNNVKGKYAARRPDDDDALGVIDDLIEALGSAEALEQALGDEDLLKGSAGASKAGTIFAAAETESTVTYEAHGNTRYGTITRTKRTNAAEDLKYDDGDPQTGERGAFAFGVTAETSRTRYVQTSGTARYEGRTLAVSGAEKQYSGDIEVSVNFTTSMVDGLITDLATGAGESWEYLFGEVDSIRLPTVKMTSQGKWEAASGAMASIGFGRRAGVYRPQSVAATFKGRLLGGNSAPGAGSEVVGVWSLGSDSKSTSYLAGGFGAERVADEPVRRPSVGDGTQVGAMLSSDNTVLENGQITLKPEQFDWLHGEFKVIAGQTGFAQDKTRTRKLRFARGKSGTDDPTARRTVKIALADVIDTEGGEYSKNSPKTHVQVAREEIQAQRDKIAGLQEIGNLQANINEAWTRALGSLQKNIFTDDSYYEFTGSSHTQSRTNLPAQTKASPTSGNWWQKLPTKVVDSAGAGGDGAQLVAPDDVLERLDAVLMALGTSEALADAFDPSADGTFAVNDSNGVEKSFLEVNKSGNLSGSKLTDPAKIFNESQWQVKVAVGSTDYTRFGVWRSQVSRNALRDRDWWNRDMESYAYSALPAAEARTQTELPNGTRATYTGKTVAYVGTKPYEGEARFEVEWYSHTETRPDAEGSNPAKKEVGAKSMVAVLTDVRNVNTGDYLYHKGKEVRQITFFRGQKHPISTDAAYYDKSKANDADGARENDPTNHLLDYTSTFSGDIGKWQGGTGWPVAIDYRDSSQTPDKAYPILYEVLFVGRSPEGPLGVMGRYEFVTEFNGNKVANFQSHNKFGTTKAESDDITKSLRIVGAFGADLP